MPEMQVTVSHGDLSPFFENAMRSAGISAWDIETDGLDFREHPIRTCQVYVPEIGVEIVKVDPRQIPQRLCDALSSERVFKLFHHAPFDLSFMRHQWSARPRNVGCTKVMSKIISPHRASHSLAPLVLEYLGIELDKAQRLSDWAADRLTPEQLQYAADDVSHLLDLYHKLWKEALEAGVGDLIEQSFKYLPVRVETDLRLAGDVFSY